MATKLPPPPQSEPKKDLDDTEIVYVYSLLRENPQVHLLRGAAEGQILKTLCLERVMFSMGGMTMIWANARRLSRGKLCADCVNYVEVWEERYQLWSRI